MGFFVVVNPITHAILPQNSILRLYDDTYQRKWYIGMSDDIIVQYKALFKV